MDFGVWWWRWVVLMSMICSAVNISPGRLPPSHSIKTLSRFFVYAKPDQALDEWYPSFGWGLWDSPYPLPARVTTSNLTVKLNRKETSLYAEQDGTMRNAVWLAVMKSEDFRNEFMDFQNSTHFCCQAADVLNGDCKEVDQFRVPPSIRSRVMMAPVAASTSHKRRTDAVFPLYNSGVYYLLLVNCMNTQSSGTTTLMDRMLGHRVRGGIAIEGTHGYLSGIDVPKMNLYFQVSMITALICVWWMVCITRALDDQDDAEFERRQSPLPFVSKIRSNKVSFVHNYMSLALALQLFESLMSYIYYSWENNSSIGADGIVQLVAIISSVVKNVISISLVLNMCLGVYSTMSVLPPYQKMRLWLYAIAFMITDLIKLLSVHFHSALKFTSPILVICSLPFTLVSLIGLLWAWNSIQRTISECRANRKVLFYKEVMLCKLRRAVIAAAAFFTASTTCQAVFTLQNPETIWKYEWIFTDATPSLLFVFILLCIAVIIRPSVQEYQAQKLAVQGIIPSPSGIRENLQIDSVQIDPRLYEGRSTGPDGYRTFGE